MLFSCTHHGVFGASTLLEEVEIWLCDISTPLIDLGQIIASNSC
ncbi:conserved protein of unknown function [Limnospira indica PCC 8005]|uniref:Uncharacterized protein n=1 Tax=Limnospira indica PCC 8005 TaxID=376219 RepID=A0A9P1KEB2_9CYAN|nr:conserved protein of unknown function [Limnospira indica PCC 8005]